MKSIYSGNEPPSHNNWVDVIVKPPDASWFCARDRWQDGWLLYWKYVVMWQQSTDSLMLPLAIRKALAGLEIKR